LCGDDVMLTKSLQGKESTLAVYAYFGCIRGNVCVEMKYISRVMPTKARDTGNGTPWIARSGRDYRLSVHVDCKQRQTVRFLPRDARNNSAVLLS